MLKWKLNPACLSQEVECRLLPLCSIEMGLVVIRKRMLHTSRTSDSKHAFGVDAFHLHVIPTTTLGFSDNSGRFNHVISMRRAPQSTCEPEDEVECSRRWWFNSSIMDAKPIQTPETELQKAHIPQKRLNTDYPVSIHQSYRTCTTNTSSSL